MRRARPWLIGLAAVLIVLLSVLWTQRKPIATGYVNRYLADRGVRARYRFEGLGFGRQRLRDVVIGDPAHPDLVADWIETEVAYGLNGPFLSGLRAGQVRVRGRVVDGKLSLGAIDRLLPASTGGSFALPKLDVQVADGRMRLATPAGLVGLKLSGRGRLDDGFEGTVAAVAPLLSAGGCRVERASLYAVVSVSQGAPRLNGPLRAAALTCAGGSAAGASAALDVTLGKALDRWRGAAPIAVSRAAAAGAALSALEGTVSFDGTRAGTGGQVELTSGRAALAGGEAAALTLAGAYRVGGETRFAGKAAAQDLRLPDALVRRLRGFAASASGTPVAPLAGRAAAAAARAGAAMDVAADLSLAGGALRIASLSANAASGARLRLAGGDGVTLAGGRTRLDGTLEIGGGGLPSGTVTLAQTEPGAPLTGVARFAPYRAADAALALEPVRFSAVKGLTRFTTRVTLSGPLADGRIDGARLAVAGLWDGAGRVRVNPVCAPFAFERLRVSSLTLGRTATQLCPLGPALVAVERGRVSGGARLGAVRLAGSLGGSPLALAWQSARYDLAAGRFAIAGADARIGAGDRVSTLRIAQLDGAIGKSIAGRFAGGAGQIGKVPLLLSDASGGWSLTRGRLALDAALTVSDAAASARFKPLVARGAKVTLVDGRVAATASLRSPATSTPVTDVVVAHDLRGGTGHADLSVPGIAFTESFQPEAITPLTFGVIADVRGTLSGAGHIAWTPDGVTSTGTFRTANTDLAAAFGPVTGITTEIRFSDLLNLESAPGQVATVGSINPGVPVTDGVFRYQTLSGARVRVEGARWPFAGGELLLEPALLDFSAPMERRLTFQVRGLDAGQFLQTFDYKNLDATGTFDGTLPMVFDQRGGFIENGRLTVRAGGGTIAYAGEVSKENLGFWGNLAFQALRSLKYRNLDIVMNGPVAGEMVTQVRFAGVSQGEGAKANFLIKRLAKLPFVFNVRIQAPFRALIDSARSFYDPNRLIERNLPQLIEEQNRLGVQPAESEKKP